MMKKTKIPDVGKLFISLSAMVTGTFLLVFGVGAYIGATGYYPESNLAGYEVQVNAENTLATMAFEIHEFKDGWHYIPADELDSPVFNRLHVLMSKKDSGIGSPTLESIPNSPTRVRIYLDSLFPDVPNNLSLKIRAVHQINQGSEYTTEYTTYREYPEGNYLTMTITEPYIHSFTLILGADLEIPLRINSIIWYKLR